MQKRKIISISILLMVFILSLSAVSANESNETILATDNSPPDLLEGIGTYTELKNLINSGNDTINLDKDYAYDSSDNLNYVGISKQITINGNGHTIDAKNLVRHFYITGNNVVLNNITFINGFGSTSYGGSIWCTGSNVTVADSTFSLNNAAHGGAVYWAGSNGKMVNCLFEDNSVTGYGGAFFWSGSNGTIDDCLFENNSASSSAGAIYWSGANGNILDSNFKDNYALNYGAAIYLNSLNSRIVNCDFNDNKGWFGSSIAIYSPNTTISSSSFRNIKDGFYAGSVYYFKQASNSVIEDCEFRDIFAAYGGILYVNSDNLLLNNVSVYNASAVYGGVLYNNGTNNKIINSNFNNNNATYGGVIYSRGSNLNVSNSNILNNLADYGAGFVLLGSNSVVENSNFVSNNATYGGGAILYNPDGIVLNGNYYSNNHSNDTQELYYYLKVQSPYDATLSNGYHAYCINRTFYPPFVNDMFLEIGNHNNIVDEKGVRIWNKLKNLFYNHYHEYDSIRMKDVLTQLLIDSSSYENSSYVPDTGAMKKINDTTIAIFDFKAVFPIERADVQSLFIFNITYLHPNMTVEKISNNQSVHLNQITSFTIKVNNTGLFNLTNIKVKEIIPEGLKYLTFDGKNWNKKGNDFIYNQTLEPNHVASFIIYFNGTRQGNFTNQIIVSSNETDNKTVNNTTRVLKPDFDVEKIAVNSDVVLNQDAIFKIVVHNTGETDLSDVRVREVIPDGLVYKSFVDDENVWSHSLVDGKHIWTLNDILKVNQSSEFYIIFNTVREGNFTNVVVADSNETDNVTNKSNITVLKPDFTVEKIALNETVTLNSQTIFEIVVHNTGENILNNVTVREIIPDGLVYDSFVDEGLWTHSLIDGEHIWTLNGALEIDEYVGFYVIFNTTRVGEFTNAVVVSTNETGNKTVNNTTRVLKPELRVEKISLNPIVTLSNQVIFEIAVYNTGEVDLDDVTVKEIIPEGLIYDSYHDTSLWTYSLIDGEHVWTLNGILKVGQLSVIYITFNTTREGNFTNVVVVNSNETGNITNNTTVKVLKPDFVIEKIAINPIVALNSQSTFEIVVHNTGKTKLSNIAVREVIPDGLVYDSFVDRGLWTHSLVDGEHVWTLNGALDVGEYVGFYVIFNTTRVGEFTNVVVVSTNETGNKTVNNTTRVLKPELHVEKISLNPVVSLGNHALFEIVVHNIGEVDLTDVYVIEESYEGLSYNSYINNRWIHSYVGDKHKWTLNATLAPGEYEGFIVIFDTIICGNFTNVVTAGSNQTNNVSVNNTTEVVTEEEYDNKTSNGTFESIELIKTTITPVVILGNQVTFQIVVHNNGDVVLKNLTINEDSFDGLIYDHFIDYLGLFDKNDNLSWTMNSPLYVGEYAEFYVVFNTTAVGTFTNVVSSRNETSNDTVKVLKSSYTIEKIVLNDTVALGDEAVFEVVVHNDGQVPIEGLTINEYSFDGLEYISYDDYLNVWSYNDLTWTLNRILHPGEYIGFFIHFKTLRDGTLVNVITSGNKSSNDTVEVVKPSYMLEKIALNKTVKIGDEIMFEIILHNNGLTKISNLTIEETSFDGLEYVGFVDNTGNWINDGLIWYYSGSLNPDEYSTLYVIFKSTSEGKFINIVTSGNKSANDTVEVVKPSYTIEKIALTKTVALGDEVTFEIVIHNTGKTIIDNIVINETSFDGLEFVKFMDYTGKWINNGLSWYYESSLAPDEYSAFYVVFNTKFEGNLTNIVTSGNKSANDTVEVLKPSFEINKIALNKFVNVGDAVIFEIVVHNNGRTNLTNITVVEYFTDGLVYDHFIDSYGVWIKNGLNWTFKGILTPGEYSRFYVVFNTTRSGNFTNVVTCGNITVNDTVEVKELENKTIDNKTENATKHDLKVSTEKQQTGNPIVVLLLVLLNLIIIKRRK